MLKKFLILSIVALLFAWTSSFAQSSEQETEGSKTPIDMIDIDEEVRSYHIVADDLPLNGTELTMEKLAELKKNARYKFLGLPMKPKRLALTGDVEQNIKTWGVLLNRAWLFSENFAESLSTIPYPAKREVVDETWRVLQEIGETIGRPINKTNNLLVKTSDSFTVLQGKVSSNENAIFALNIEEMNRKGFPGITVKGKMNHLGQVYELIDMDGKIVDFKYIIPTGNLGGDQSENVEKVVAVAYDTNTANFAVLLDADTSDGKIFDDGTKEIILSKIASKCTYQGARNRIRLLCISDDESNQLFPNHEIAKARVTQR
jgi:hypothetical protein